MRTGIIEGILQHFGQKTCLLYFQVSDEKTGISFISFSLAQTASLALSKVLSNNSKASSLHIVCVYVTHVQI